ncbi:unnamed protein product [Coregonus sp. 'balchen']|nr:unnamed protein product [Coregonus sp. 'balchen']
MATDQEKNKQLLIKLLERPGNGSCVDCGDADPEWASYTLGVFVCQSCSGLHRNIYQISKVKSVLLDPWSDAEVETARYREGFLWKRGRDNGQFLSRKCILSERDGALKYFNKHDPSKIGQPHGLQVTYLKDNSTRNIFVYHEDGKEMVDWFNAIRAARFHYLQVAFPGAHHADLTRNYIKEGYMEKTGPKHTEGFKKRWFTMDDRRLMYFKDPLDAYARGEVFIGSKENSYTVLPGLPPSTQGYHWQFGITIVTPDRKFLFACETEEEQQDWMSAFQGVWKPTLSTSPERRRTRKKKREPGLEARLEAGQIGSFSSSGEK